jgi:hypothetical protein
VCSAPHSPAQVLEEHKRNGVKVDLILTDILMPEVRASLAPAQCTLPDILQLSRY